MIRFRVMQNPQLNFPDQRRNSIVVGRVGCLVDTVGQQLLTVGTEYIGAAVALKPLQPVVATEFGHFPAWIAMRGSGLE